MQHLFKKILMVLPCLVLLSCTEGQLAANVYKSVPQKGDRQMEGLFKVGRPYEVEGKWYTPQETYTYTETGIASWYGPGFHGKRTANGEVFDMNELTAAHRTLQMPSLVRVTNLENGRSLVVRVNDRGPFKRSRVIDLSKKAAELLGITGRGTGRVRLDIMGDESRQIASAARMGQDTSGYEVAMNENRPMPSYKAASAPAPVPMGDFDAPAVPGHVEGGKFLPDPIVSQYPVTPTSIYVQVGAFSASENADRMAVDMTRYGQAHVVEASVRGESFYRVRVGPVASVTDADALMSRLVADGVKQAIVVVD
ncbi:MAG: septal ring lytic transglycosylase RlpA family protein [Alphaproteobacteria bacterium]